jgi:hypothetical protein
MADASKPNWQDLADFDMSLPDDALALVERFQGTWGNGGLAQLFSNWNRADIVLIPEALTIIGAPGAAQVVQAAIAHFPVDQDSWRDLGYRAMTDQNDPRGNELWTLNAALAAQEPDMAKAVTAFELKLSENEDL